MQLCIDGLDADQGKETASDDNQCSNYIYISNGQTLCFWVISRGFLDYLHNITKQVVKP